MLRVQHLPHRPNTTVPVYIPQVLLLVSLRLGIVPAIAGVSVTLLMVPLQAALVK